MENEVEDIVGDVKYTDSQKSVTTSALYSLDFTDSSSDKNNSTGKDTYVIDYDSDDSDKTFQVHKSESKINLTDKESILNVRQDSKATNLVYSMDKSAGSSLPVCNIIAQEIFTQTSKTIIELAQKDTKKPTENTLETQTSFVSITENKSIAYKIHILGRNCSYNSDELREIQYTNENLCKQNIQNIQNYSNNVILTNTFEDTAAVFCLLEKDKNTDVKIVDKSAADVIRFIEDESKENAEKKSPVTTHDSYASEFESSNFDSDIENDSLMENEYFDSKTKSRDDNSETSEMMNSIDSDVEELYNKLSKSPQLLSPILSVEPPIRNFGLLSPLTEETVQKKESIVDVTPSLQTLTKTSEYSDNDTLFENNASVKVSLFSDRDSAEENNHLKLPPIYKNESCPSPHLNFLFTLNNQKHIEKTGMLPSLYERQNEQIDRWEIGTKNLASGESPHINKSNGPMKITKENIHLPSIHLEGLPNNTSNRTNCFTSSIQQSSINGSFDIISIQGKIKELKMSSNKTRPKYSSRSGSPSSLSSPNETRICDTAEKACDVFCAELLRRLRSSSWLEIKETLEDLPRAFEKFWSVVTENRIADLIRQVSLHIESPRTQVARAACKTLAEILKNTNYTKKPDFYEAMSTLLTKTGSYNRPVRREANVALDDIVCSVDVTHCVAAICVYGVGHKSVLVRCSSARLLVVCCALAEGGRQILRTRPPSAAAARRHALRSLAELLQDKNTDTRKYAERLYAILRPLPNFEAYFLTDVDVELASKHMKKYDQLLNNSKSR
ncbi:uncharacterized protein LOC125067298 [Vanessa atalanta]|uniref:uncharacterized protein LOC125067298 n=1 Tax=Vanessa atalanta TaxID=42275 RepID=UPI001FCD439F|nr:uncharacterized protein LOC125067298 [Vanessa atalanta]